MIVEVDRNDEIILLCKLLDHLIVEINQQSRKRDNFLSNLGTIYFGLQVYPMGSIVIALVCPLVCLSLNILETAHSTFLELFMKLGVNKVKKVTRPEF